MLVKELADRSGVPKGTIDHYLAEKCTAPIAENAVKIARALGVTVEYLVTGENAETLAAKAGLHAPVLDTKLCKKYYSVIQKLDSMPEGIRLPLCRMILELQ